MNVKEKDLVHKALGLAESVGSKVSEMEGTLEEAASHITGNVAQPLNGYLKTVSTSSPTSMSGPIDVVNVSGAGALHLATISRSSGSVRQAYLIITLDDEYTFYLDSAGYSHQGSVATRTGLFTAGEYIDYLNYYNSGDMRVYASCDRNNYRMKIPWYWTDDPDAVSGARALIPDECKSTSTMFCYIVSPRPLKFEKSLNVKVMNGSTYQANCSIVYSLDGAPPNQSLRYIEDYIFAQNLKIRQGTLGSSARDVFSIQGSGRIYNLTDSGSTLATTKPSSTNYYYDLYIDGNKQSTAPIVDNKVTYVIASSSANSSGVAAVYKGMTTFGGWGAENYDVDAYDKAVVGKPLRFNQSVRLNQNASYSNRETYRFIYYLE